MVVHAAGCATVEQAVSAERGQGLVAEVFRLYGREYLKRHGVALAQNYVSALQAVANPTADQQARLQSNLDLLARNQATLAAAQAAPPPPAGTAAPVVTQPAPTAAQTAAVPTVQKYIANLSAVANPTAEQTAKLAMYQERLKLWGG